MPHLICVVLKALAARWRRVEKKNYNNQWALLEIACSPCNVVPSEVCGALTDTFLFFLWEQLNRKSTNQKAVAEMSCLSSVFYPPWQALLWSLRTTLRDARSDNSLFSLPPPASAKLVKIATADSTSFIIMVVHTHTCRQKPDATEYCIAFLQGHTANLVFKSIRFVSSLKKRISFGDLMHCLQSQNASKSVLVYCFL